MREETLLKISDFGLSKLVRSDTGLKTICGTPYYVAPEILESRANRDGAEYSAKVDVWSLGVVLYTMLSGTLPFSDDYGTTAASQIMRGDFQFRSNRWERVSLEAKLLVKNILVVQPEKRPGLDQIIEFVWLRDEEMYKKAHALMGFDDEDNTIVVDESDVDSEITLHAMNISDDEGSSSPPAKRQRLR